MFREAISRKVFGVNSYDGSPTGSIQFGLFDGHLRTDDANNEARVGGSRRPRSFAVSEDDDRIRTRPQVLCRTDSDCHIGPPSAVAFDRVQIEDGFDAVDRFIDMKEP